LFFFCTSTLLYTQSFQDVLKHSTNLSPQRQQYLADSFFASLPQTPLIEHDTLVWFFFNGNGLDVSVASDMNGWSTNADAMQRMGSTTLWYTAKVFETDARFDYKLVVDGTWMLDPKNPYTVTAVHGPNSELRMPAYIPPREINHRPDIEHGKLIDTTFNSVVLGNSREVRVYLPAQYDVSTERYPLIVFHDGLDYLRLASASSILDNLIADGVIPPCIAVFVPPVHRTEEYAGGKMDDYCSFIMQELLPVIDAKYRTRTDPTACAVIGAANGGNIALYLAMKHHERFGNVAAQSSNIITQIHQAYDVSPPLPLRIYMDLGKYDIPVLIPLVRDFTAMLGRKQYEHMYREYNQGHSWGNWRAHVSDALKYFFTKLLAASRDDHDLLPNGFRIDGPYPNPAVGYMRLEIRMERPEPLTVLLHDLGGRVLHVVANNERAAGDHVIHLDLRDVASGTYMIRVQVGPRSETRVIVLR